MLRCRRCPPATSAPAQPLTSSSADLTRTAYQPSLSLRALASWFAAHGHCADGLLRFGRQALPTSRPSNLEATLQKWQSAALMSVAASNARPQWSPAAMWPGALGTSDAGCMVPSLLPSPQPCRPRASRASPHSCCPHLHLRSGSVSASVHRTHH